MAVSTCKNATGKPDKSTKEGRRAYALAQEMKLIKAIAGNNKTVRDRALKKIDKWLQFRMKQIPLTEEDAMRIWKGLFYAIWASDKPLIQEEHCDRISALVHLGDTQLSIMFFKCGLKTLGNEWFGIDQLRLDKFLMFVRRLLRNGFTILRDDNWNVKSIRNFNEALSETVLNIAQPPPAGLTMHFTEIYLEELAKVSRGKMNPHLTTEFLRPFVKQLSVLKDARQMSCIKKFVFRYLLEQSDSGIEYQAKFRAWSAQGFPGGSIDAMQRVPIAESGTDNDVDAESDDEWKEDEEGGPLDPRAGHVDVLLPQLKFVCKEVLALLKEYRFAEGSNTKCRKTIASIIEWYTKMSRGEYPLGMKRLNLPKDDGYSTKTKKAVNRLVKFERRIGLGKKRKAENDAEEQNDKNGLEVNGEQEVVSNRKKKRRKVKDDFVAEDILEQDFLEKQKLLRRSKKADDVTPEEGYEFSFKRNSGRWYVYNCSGDDSVLSVGDDGCNQSFECAENVEKPKENGERRDKLFAQDDWDADVPQADSPLQRNKHRKRKFESATSTPVRNPFAKLRTPNSSPAKKVKIDLKLNSSQEVHEHLKKVRSSPGIPFDAKRMPSKPLLKARISTPIDPFYAPK